jgi:hypothetical protein
MFEKLIIKLVNRFFLFFNVRQDICPWKPAAVFLASEAGS